MYKRQLDPGTLLLAFLTAEEQTFLFALTTKTLSVFTLPLGIKALQQQIEAFRKALDIYPGAKSGRINFSQLWREQIFDRSFFQFLAVGLKRTRIFLEIFPGAKLRGIHEDGCDDGLTLGKSRANERQMARVQRAHGRHESDWAAFGTRLARHLLHPFDGVDGLQGIGRTGFTGCGKKLFLSF